MSQQLRFSAAISVLTMALFALAMGMGGSGHSSPASPGVAMDFAAVHASE